MIDVLLTRYYEVMGRNPLYTALRSFVIEGHEVAWMEYRGTTGNGTGGQPYAGRELHCECHFSEGIGFCQDEDGRPMRMMGPDKCPHRATVMDRRHQELREAFGDRAKDLPHVIFDLIAKKKAGEWLEGSTGAEFWGGYFYVQTLAKICDVPVRAAWDAVLALVREKKISLEGAVIRDYHEPPPPAWTENFRIRRKGLTGIALLPTHGEMPQRWKFQVKKGRKVVKTGSEPLDHAPWVGPDVDDVANAQRRLRQLIDAAAKASKK